MNELNMYFVLCCFSYLILHACLFHRQHCLNRIDRNEKFLKTLPPKHQELLQTYRGRLEEFRKCVKENQELLNLIVKNVSSMFENIQPIPKEMVRLKKIIKIIVS